MAKDRQLASTLSAATVNGYMTKFRAVMNFAFNEGWVERNPAKGLQVIDPVRRRDKRLPFSPDQLRLIIQRSALHGLCRRLAWLRNARTSTAPPRSLLGAAYRPVLRNAFERGVPT